VSIVIKTNMTNSSALEGHQGTRLLLPLQHVIDTETHPATLTMCLPHDSSKAYFGVAGWREQHLP
jgi:hypothetical protein